LYFLKEETIADYAKRQQAISRNAWHFLKDGGVMIYATCSVFAQENDDVVAAFAATEPRARRLPPPDGEPAQWLPDAQHDGFFYAVIEKRA
jgi:16S rRNA (cytosine967-C5)-methyltransferase